MKIVFAAFRHDPMIISNRQGADRQFLDALKANGNDCQVIGPFNKNINLIEKVFRGVVRLLSKKAYMKHDLTNTSQASRALDQAIIDEDIDLVFSLYPASLAFYKGKTPCVLRTDATIKGVLEESPEFLKTSPLLRWYTLWVEIRALRKSILVITHSEWSRKILENEYKIDPNRIVLFPNPSSLPSKINLQKQDNYNEKTLLERPLRLLFVGQDPHRKGLNIALEVVERLNRAGIQTILTVCGLSGNSSKLVKYKGKLNLNNPNELDAYITELSKAHLLLHPAVFDPAPRVCSEAAAFGTPTITNNTGGLGTSVQDGISGIVLPKASPPEVYVQTIVDLVNDPERYQRLCQTTRERYEKELNWDVAGKRLVSILEEAVRELKAKGKQG